MEELLAFIVECIGEHDLSMWWVLVRMRGTRQQLGSSVRVVTTTVVWPLPATSHMDHPSLLVFCRGEPASVRPRAASSRHSCWCGHCGQQPGGAGRVQCNYINQMLSPAAPSPLSARLSRCLSTAPVHIFVMLLSRRWTLNSCNISEKIVPR